MGGLGNTVYDVTAGRTVVSAVQLSWLRASTCLSRNVIMTTRVTSWYRLDYSRDEHTKLQLYSTREPILDGAAHMW